jgi:hypothetical protein
MKPEARGIVWADWRQSGPSFMQTCELVVALRAPGVPHPGKNSLQPIMQSVNTYRTSIDTLHHRLFTIVAGVLRYFGSSGICSYAF